MTIGQQIRFKNLCESVNQKKITMNQAYKKAKLSFSNANGESENGFGGNFKDWVSHAQNEGWIDQAFGVLGTIIKQRQPAPPPPPPPATKSATSPFLWLGLSAVVIIGGVAIYKLSKAK